MGLRKPHTACLSLNLSLAIMNASMALKVSFGKLISPYENVPLTKFLLCSFMQFGIKPLQSDWPISVEFTEGD